MAVAVLSGYVTLGKLAGVADPFDPVAVPVGGPVRDVDGAMPTPKPLQDVGQGTVRAGKVSLLFLQIHSLLVAGLLPSFICAHGCHISDEHLLSSLQGWTCGLQSSAQT